VLIQLNETYATTTSKLNVEYRSDLGVLNWWGGC